MSKLTELADEIHTQEEIKNIVNKMKEGFW
jgi:hypothetical protein